MTQGVLLEMIGDFYRILFLIACLALVLILASMVSDDEEDK